MKFKFLTGGLLMVACIAQGQSGVSTQGATFKTAKGSLQWTIGESATSTLRTSQAMLTQGFNQHPQFTVIATQPPTTTVPPAPTTPPVPTPPGTLTVTGTSNTAERSKMEVFPNPVENQLTVSMNEGPKEVLYRLLTADGKIVSSGAFQGAQYNLDFSIYSAGTYLLILNQANQSLNAFKIIKK